MARVFDALRRGVLLLMLVMAAPAVTVLAAAGPGPAPSPEQAFAALSGTPYRVDGASRELTRDGQRVELQPKEFDLAWYLFLHRDRLVRREELVAAIWGRDLGGSARTLDTHLYTLRRKLMFAENGLRLSNVYREGYRLELAPAATSGSGD